MAATSDTYSVAYNLRADVVETLGMGNSLGTSPVVQHVLTACSGTLTAATTPAISQLWAEQFDIATGATVTKDLTALVRGDGHVPNLDMTDLKVNLVRIASLSTNTTTVTVDVAAATGYNLFGEDAAGLEQITLEPGDVYMMYCPETRAVVAAAEKDVDFDNSAGATATVEVLIGAGV